MNFETRRGAGSYFIADTFREDGTEICLYCDTAYRRDPVDFSYCDACRVWTCERCYREGRTGLPYCIYCEEID